MAEKTVEPYLITGVKGDVYPRLEIRELVKNDKQFTLFILGWDKIRQPDHSPLASQFVQQGGIHGRPYQRWPGDPEEHHPSHEGSPASERFYAVLFPTWHRPSLLLLEQSISLAAKGIAERFANNYPNEGPQWQQAAKELRFPFWDWTHPDTGKDGFPKILYQKKLTLALPGNSNKKVDNILAFYDFGNPRPEGFQNVPQEGAATAFYKSWERTYRWPTDDEHDPKEQFDKLNEALTGEDGWKELQGQVESIFEFDPANIPEDRRANVWDQFSNTRFQSGQSLDEKGKPTLIPQAHVWRRAGNIETPHNNIHDIVGGIGHMSDNNYASFDPVFFLHHCNVDRLVAFWEHIYPEVHIGEDGYLASDGSRLPFTEKRGTYTLEQNQEVKGSTGLTPFRKGDRSYWNSHNTRWAGEGSVSMYYTYPSIPDPEDPTNPERAVNLGKETTLEERQRQRAALQKHFGGDVVQIRQRVREGTEDLNLFAEFKEKPQPGYEKIHDYRHFVVQVFFDSYALGGTYSVNVWYDLGDAGSGHVGRVSVLARSDQANCAGCQSRIIEGVKGRQSTDVPHYAVVKILSHWRNENPGKEVENSGEIILKALRADIRLPGGRTLARLDVSGNATGQNSGLPEALVPVIHLSSASIQALSDPNLPHDEHRPQDTSPLTPYETYDWMDHGELSGGWVKVD